MNDDAQKVAVGLGAGAAGVGLGLLLGKNQPASASQTGGGNTITLDDASKALLQQLIDQLTQLNTNDALQTIIDKLTALVNASGGGISLFTMDGTPLGALTAPDDAGVSNAGSNITLVDNQKYWDVNIWSGALLAISINGQEYRTVVISNTANSLTFNALPSGVIIGKNKYTLKRLSFGLILAQATQNPTAVLAATDILSSDITPANPPDEIRVTVMTDTSAVFSVIITNNGVTTTCQLNAGVNINANCLYSFDIQTVPGDSLNFQVSIAGNVMLRAVEITSS